MMEEKLPELPQGWVWALLGDMVTVIRGASPRPKGSPKYFGGDIPWIMISDINREKGKYISKTKDTVTPEGAKKSRYLKAGTLILSNSGTVCIPKLLAVDACIHDGFVAFPDLHLKQLNSFYLYHYFNYIRLKIIQENRQGVTQVNLNTNIVKNFLIPLPPFPEQHRIVDKIEQLFSRLDAGIGSLKKVQAQIKRYRQAVLKHAFEGKLTAAWREANKHRLEPASELHVKIKERIGKKANGEQSGLQELYTSGLAKLPDKWVWTKLGDIGKIASGGTPSTKEKKYYDGDIPWITPIDLRGFKKKYIERGRRNITKKGLEESSATLLPKNTVLFTSRAPIGYVAIASNPIATNQGFKNVILSDEVFCEYLYYYLKASKSLIEKYASGTTFLEISASKMKLIPFPLCSIEEQKKIVEEIERRFSIADRVEEIVEQNLKRAERLRQSILKKAFEGKLVPQDPTDEPASVLLERIKAEKEKNASKKDQRRRSKK